MKKQLIKIMTLVLLCLPALAVAETMNTLRYNVNTEYPLNIDTVGQAMMYIMAATDYKLAIGYPASTTASEIVARPIPPEAIHENIMPVYQALLLLIGNDSRLVVDEKHKLITVEKMID